ncbi:mechanosensitive ion channel domain-containing protein [Devosia neptuniae]|jgi:small-conductance mechanosensitive channel|uniref:mechanosensitive ion channel domain-containing protein n=1 Tax=Devosia TaxID=46913 RepID=UPI0022AFA636|nr:mechanosensitive ion channel domain-containing protein [Devosia neptuniae]MCZ4346427.1 mechanosensitive ion channel [Devosia neptuniae]|tara:strand:+ start:702 stop:2960 length:2259 start_codon:yes stop_codon:yes gene_type:complete
MRYFFILVSLLALMFPAYAQTSLLGLGEASETASEATGSTDASIDALIKIIENDETRAALIERLQQAEGGEASASASEPASADLSIVRQVAEYTQAAAEGASATILSLGAVFMDLQAGISGTDGASLSMFMDVVGPVLLVAVGLFGSYLVLRMLAHLLSGRMAAGLERKGWLRRVVGALLAVLIDLSTVLLAWGIGYVVALNFSGATPGRMGINQSLLLNAFLLVEITKLVVRAVLAPRLPALRMLPVTDDNAAYWFFWISRIISLIGYTFLFIAPLLAANLSPAMAAAVKVLVMATAATIAIIIVMQNRDDVRNWLNSRAEKREDGLGHFLVALGRSWHVIAIVYLLALLVVWFANPEEALPFMLAATVQSVLAVIVGVVIVSVITRFVSTGLNLPSDIKDRLPLLETRLKAFVPKVMQVVRWVVIVGVVLAIAQAWSVFDFAGWISTDEGQGFAGSVISAALIILVCLVLYVAVSSWIEFRLNPNFGSVPTAREKTLLGLFRNAFTIALVVFGVMLALAQIGVNIAPLLAGAGVIGLAIGFGAQSLVQDIITGIFIQFENVMNEGDVVAVGDKSGVVEKLTIRSVTIRDLSGTVHLIPFSSVSQVSNMVRGFSFHLSEMGVAYDSDIPAVKQAMFDAFDRLMETEHKDHILDNLEMHGVTGFGDSAITVRARIKTVPGEQWSTGRAYNEIIKSVFEERGIEIPYPHVTYVAPASPSKPSKSTNMPPQVEGTAKALESYGPNEADDGGSER